MMNKAHPSRSQANVHHRIFEECEEELKKGDMVIYACVIIGAGAFLGVLGGLGVGYLTKSSFKEK